MLKSRGAGVSADEIIALLRRSCLPTIIVEGGDDIILFRKLEDELASFNVDVFGAGGRNTLFEVFSRRAEINNNKKIAFIADREWWVCSAIPAEFMCEELLFTDGYSIENDVYRDGNLEQYMDTNESKKFKLEIEVVIECYALGISRIFNSQEGKIAFHPNLILDDAAQCRDLLQLIPLPHQGELARYWNDSGRFVAVAASIQAATEAVLDLERITLTTSEIRLRPIMRSCFGARH